MLRKTFKNFIFKFNNYNNKENNFVINVNQLNSIIKSNHHYYQQHSLYSSTSSLLGRPRIDEEIPSDFVRYVNEHGTLVGIKSLRSILSSLDRSQYCIVEVNKSETPPVCRLTNKKEFFEAQRKLSK